MVFLPRRRCFRHIETSNGVARGRKKNVNVCAIKGNFDDAQTGVKQIFSDTNIAKELDEKGYFLSRELHKLGQTCAADSILFQRIPCDLMNAGDITLGDEIDVCVPTGNFGNIFAAYLAKRMGLPVRRFICASNVNQRADRLYQHGHI